MNRAAERGRHLSGFKKGHIIILVTVILTKSGLKTVIKANNIAIAEYIRRIIILFRPSKYPTKIARTGITKKITFSIYIYFFVICEKGIHRKIIILPKKISK